MWMIVIPGMLYGLSSAEIYVIGYSYIRDIFDSKKAAYYLGRTAAMQSIGQIAGPVVGGANPASIAERLCISVTTAYKHIANMYKKMEVSNRREFIARLYGTSNRELLTGPNA